MQKYLASIVLLLFLLSCPLFQGSCQSTDQSSELSYRPIFEKFEIRKILGGSIQSLEVQMSQNEWPEVQYKHLAPIKFAAKKIKIAVIGDTGCRLKESKGKTNHQNCSLSGEWPYAQVIRSLLKEKYDFVVHTGDYHYREQCTDKKLCPTYSKSVGYGWSSWWDDFYSPSLDLFKKSPLLFIRGNHEDCKRAHVGWGPLSNWLNPWLNPRLSPWRSRII